jgi:hypothetical protein
MRLEINDDCVSAADVLMRARRVRKLRHQSPHEPAAVPLDVAARLPPSVRQIIKTVEERLQLPAYAVLGRRRLSSHLRARWMAIALFRHFHSRASINQIGIAFGVDHTTVMNALARVDDLRRDDFYFDAAFEKLRDILAAE